MEGLLDITLQKANPRFLTCRWPFQTWFSSRRLPENPFRKSGETSSKDPLNLAMSPQGSIYWLAQPQPATSILSSFPLGVIDMFWSWEDHTTYIIITTTHPNQHFDFRKIVQKQHKQPYFFLANPFFLSFSLGGLVVFGSIRQDVLGSIFADRMLSMSSEPSQPGAHDTADHFTGWVPTDPQRGGWWGGIVPGFNKKREGKIERTGSFCVFVFCFSFFALESFKVFWYCSRISET